MDPKTLIEGKWDGIGLIPSEPVDFGGIPDGVLEISREYAQHISDPPWGFDENGQPRQCPYDPILPIAAGLKFSATLDELRPVLRAGVRESFAAALAADPAILEAIPVRVKPPAPKRKKR